MNEIDIMNVVIMVLWIWNFYRCNWEDILSWFIIVFVVSGCVWFFNCGVKMRNGFFLFMVYGCFFVVFVYNF